MKLLWVCNAVPAQVRFHISGRSGSAFWIDHVLSDIREKKIALRILCRGGEGRGALDENCSYVLFPELPPHQYSEAVEALFLKEIREYEPDVIHIWGSEYSHTLAMVNAAESAGMLNRVVISIQGLCSVYAGHYNEGVPEKILRGYTFRDFIRRDNLKQQSEIFALRGEYETQALKKVSHVMGRTDWDRGCMEIINPHARYHVCRETLRHPFYEGAWTYENCRKHRIFASSCSYPIKGFHYLLEAFAQVVKRYPDATLAVPGKDFRDVGSWNRRLREGSYDRYLRSLVRKYQLENRVEILGSLSAEQMKEQYLAANVFALPSTIENSPNSLGEAMLLGVPCVTALVGGVSTMLKHGEEGLVYQSTAPYMLAHYICSVFAMEENAGTLGRAAAVHAAKTHDPEANLTALLTAYREVAAAAGKE